MLAQRGIEAGKAAKDNLKAAYERFMMEGDPARKEDAGKDLLREIFGQGAIAKDSILQSSATRLD